MVIVAKLVTAKIDFYGTKKVADFIDGLRPKIRNQQKINLYARLLKKYLDDGLQTYNFKNEKDGIFRLELIKSTRIIGFFNKHQGKQEFIAVDWYEKKRKKNSKLMNAAINKAMKIKKNNEWRKGNI